MTTRRRARYGYRVSIDIFALGFEKRAHFVQNYNFRYGLK